MPAAFALAQVAVVASTSAETFGRTSIEAQAMGCPVIVTDIGAAPETIVPASSRRQNFTGWVVPCHDPAAIAERIAQAVAFSPQERATLGVRAQHHVAANFSLGQMQLATLKVYDELLGTSLAARFEQQPLPPPSSR
jgi:glycosyltransferase involved in cell wall biosynthesis